MWVPLNTTHCQVRVILGNGTLSRLSDEISRLTISAPLLLITRERATQALQLSEDLDNGVAGIFNESTMHTPYSVTEKPLSYAKIESRFHYLNWGGSTIGWGERLVSEQFYVIYAFQQPMPAWR